MPIYLYQHPKTEEVREIVQRMNEPHVYTDDKGVKWNRVFVKPQAAINTQISATDKHQFVEKTRGKNYTIGQLWDMSQELSNKRGGMSGQDEVRAKAEKAYTDKTKKPHPHAKKKKFVI